jgi:hypothetical protein
MNPRLLGVLLAYVLGAVGLVGCAGSDSGGGASAPPGGYDAQGYPLDERGNVSSNPDDYKQSVCATPFAKEAPDYDQECK